MSKVGRKEGFVHLPLCKGSGSGIDSLPSIFSMSIVYKQTFELTNLNSHSILQHDIECSWFKFLSMAY